jgi:hypothetical protein
MASGKGFRLQRDLFQADQAAAGRTRIVEQDFMNIAYREKFQPPTPAEIGPLVEAKRAEGNPIVMATLAMHTQLVVCPHRRGSDLI